MVQIEIVCCTQRQCQRHVEFPRQRRLLSAHRLYQQRLTLCRVDQMQRQIRTGLLQPYDDAPGLAAAQGQSRHGDASDHIFQDGVIMLKAVETAQDLRHLGPGGRGDGLVGRKITLAQYPSVQQSVRQQGQDGLGIVRVQGLRQGKKRGFGFG